MIAQASLSPVKPGIGLTVAFIAFLTITVSVQPSNVLAESETVYIPGIL